MSLSFRTRGNYIDFVNTDETVLHVETVIKSLHKTSRCIDWSLPGDTSKITFTIDEVKYENVPITDIDFDGTPMDSQDDFETGITGMFTGLTGGGGASYKVYTALLSQTLTDPPTATVLENTIGDIVWTRDDQGVYLATLAGAFPATKTFSIIQNNQNENKVYTIGDWSQPDVLYIQNFDSGSLNDGLSRVSIEIRVYP